MRDSPARPPATGKAALLAGLLTLQVACTFFFIADVVADLATGDHDPHDWFEFAVVGALTLGTVFTAREVMRIFGRQRRIEEQLRAASGAFAELVEEHFETWGLTPSERDVAMMAIKGLPTAEIARIRGTAEGTVKAQSNRIYAKAGVTGRTQLLSLFIEELLAGPLVEREAAE